MELFLLTTPRRFLAALCGMLALIVTPAAAISFTDRGDAALLAGQIAGAMTDGELLGQVLFLGWQGKSPSAEILRWVGTRAIGGIKIFPRNVTDLTSLVRDVSVMQKLAAKNRFAIPLFVATDQEGGWVRHIRGETSVSPGNLALGAAGAPGDAYKTGYYLGLELAALGINMDFAPDADVYANPKAAVIGPRSFGSDPSAAGLLSAAYARGMKDAGVLCAAKHFPGHGSADQDSHGHLPQIDVSFDQLLDRDLIPYRILIREGIPAVMSGHLAFPRILDKETPASLSSFFLRTVLRDRLGFKGLVITDDMEMEGVLVNGLDTPAACRQALQAGNDMVLVSHTPAVQEKTWNALIAVMKSDNAFRVEVRESVTRILETKLRYFRSAHVAVSPDSSALLQKVPAPGASNFFAQLSARAVTLIAGRRIPYRPAARERILLCSQYAEFLAEGKRRYPNADTLLFNWDPFYHARPEDRADVRSRAAAYDTVIFCIANYNSLEVLSDLKGMARKLIVISCMSPVYLTDVPWVETAVAVYGGSHDSFRAGFGVIAGDYMATGVLPIRFTLQGRP
jgi:beta-N-acetylhexosaminidase